MCGVNYIREEGYVQLVIREYDFDLGSALSRVSNTVRCLRPVIDEIHSKILCSVSILMPFSKKGLWTAAHPPPNSPQTACLASLM